MEKKLLNKLMHENQNLKYFYILSSFYMLGVLTSLTVSARLFPFHIPFTDYNVLLSGGTWIIPFTFFIQDIATEVYGCSKSNEIVILSIPIIAIYIFYLKLTTLFPYPDIPNIVTSYNEIFNALPRHLIALLAALSVGILVNNFVLDKLKSKFKGQYLPMRFIIATTLGEASLQLIGTTIAWFGKLSFTTEILPFILFSFFYKVSFEAVLTPVNTFLSRWLKNAEGIDVFNS